MVYTLFIVIICLASILMIGIVLIQESKGGGLASNFSASNELLGVRKTTDFIEKATWGLAIALVVCSIVCAYTAPQATGDQSVLEQSATQNEATNPTNTQGFGAGQAPATGAQQNATKGTAAPATKGNAAPASNGTAAPAEPTAPTSPAK